MTDIQAVAAANSVDLPAQLTMMTGGNSAAVAIDVLWAAIAQHGGFDEVLHPSQATCAVHAGIVDCFGIVIVC